MQVNDVEKSMCARGSAIGFTKDAEPVCAAKTRSAAWVISVHASGIVKLTLIDPRTRRFGNKTEAARYAATLIDDAVTAEKRWW